MGDAAATRHERGHQPVQNRRVLGGGELSQVVVQSAAEPGGLVVRCRRSLVAPGKA
jgi:hypothetical protein